MEKEASLFHLLNKVVCLVHPLEMEVFHHARPTRGVSFPVRQKGTVALCQAHQEMVAFCLFHAFQGHSPFHLLGEEVLDVPTHLSQGVVSNLFCHLNLHCHPLLAQASSPLFLEEVHLHPTWRTCL